VVRLLENVLPVASTTQTINGGANSIRVDKLLRQTPSGYLLVAVGYMDPGNWATDLAGWRQVRLRAAVRRYGLQLNSIAYRSHWPNKLRGQPER
jgi:hypothetical protein